MGNQNAKQPAPQELRYSGVLIKAEFSNQRISTEESLGYLITFPQEILWTIWDFIMNDIYFPRAMKTLCSLSEVNMYFHELVRNHLAKLVYKNNNPYFNPTFCNEIEQKCKENTDTINWIIVNQQPRKIWQSSLTSPAFKISKNGKSLHINKHWEGQVLEHSAMTNYCFFRGKHSISFRVNNPGHWGFSIGVSVEILGIYPEAHCMQIFSDGSYGYFNDSFFIPDNIQEAKEPSLLENYFAFYDKRFDMEKVNSIRWADGDIISITVDLDEKLLIFFVNKQQTLICRGLEINPDPQYQQCFRFSFRSKVTAALLSEPTSITIN